MALLDTAFGGPNEVKKFGLALKKIWMRFHLEDDVDACVRLRGRFDVSEMRF